MFKSFFEKKHIEEYEVEDIYIGDVQRITIDNVNTFEKMVNKFKPIVFSVKYQTGIKYHFLLDGIWFTHFYNYEADKK